MIKTMSAVAVAAALAACAATAQPSADAPEPAQVASPPVAAAAPPPLAAAALPERQAVRAPAIECSVRTVRTGNGVRVEGVVRAARGVAGEYDLTIAKSGGGGSSDISQGGPFEAAPGRSVTLSGAEINMGRGARLRADLRILEDGREVCRRTFRS